MKKLLSLGKTATSFSLIKDISALQKMRALYHGRMSHKHKESSVVIFGDSISTMEGHTPLHYPCYYTYLLCLRNGMQGDHDAWWYLVSEEIKKKHNIKITVNSACSGAAVTGTSRNKERINDIGARGDPRFILVYLGYNDYARQVPVIEFREEYYCMVKAIRARYPAATVLCSTLLMTEKADLPAWQFPRMEEFEQYNKMICKAVEKAAKEDPDPIKCRLVKLDPKEKMETLDGAHPTQEGHISLGIAWFNALRASGIL